jgi:hypothetical protein
MRRLPLSLLLAGALALAQVLPATAQTAPAPPAPLAPLPAAPPPLWPHTVTLQGATVTVYQPQAISWPDEKRLTARAALAIQRPGDKDPIVGTIEVAFDTQVDAATRTVSLSAPQLLGTHFPALDTAQATQLQDRIAAMLPTIATRPVPLAAVLGSLKQTPAVKNVALNNDPPVIFHAQGPASLVVFDGDPVMAPIGDTGISFALNTNWPVFSDPAGHWYLLDGRLWLAAPAATGPYKPTTALPAAFKAVAADKSFTALKQALPPRPPAGPAPSVFVSTRPAEIIVIAGAPQFVPIPGTALQYVKNTSSDLFLDPSIGRFYYLVSGRWFSSAGLDGPWQFATGDLPPDFSLIPPNSPKADVLVSVPGTAAAQQAVLEAQLPQQGTLKRSTAKLDVAYAGPPSFKPIPNTTLTYATNTTYQVIGAEGRYYACYQGAWFVAPSPTGPWVLADSIPAAIYAIPPNSPLYNVTYVQVYAATPETVTYGFTAGYALGFITAGVLAYGTGYYYPPVVVPGRIPGYFPYPYSYAGGVAYNTATGTWARGGAVYGPYGGAGAFSAYNPATGTYAHGAATWGPYGGSAHASFYNPSTGVGGSTEQHANAYGRWGSSQVSGPNKTVDTASASNGRGAVGGFSSSTGAQGAAVHGAGGNNAAVVKGSGGDVYAGADGNVYKHTDSGWQKYDNGSWNDVQKPTTTQAPTKTQAQTQTQAQTRTLNRSTASNTARTTTPGATRPAGTGGGSARMDSTSYNQLEQDRQARGLGAQQQPWRGGGGAGRFGGERGGGGWRR